MRCDVQTVRTRLTQVWLGRARRDGDLPDLAQWLTVAELAAVATYRSRERREGWLAGRILAKQLVRSFLEDDRLAPREIEILSRNAGGRGVRPSVFVRGEERALSLSISHSEHLVVAACANGNGVSVGIDLTQISEVQPHALLAWFTPVEKARLAEAELADVAESWAIKEAVYKATNEGESFAPLRIEIEPAAENAWTGRVKDRARPVEDISTWLDEGHVTALAVVPVATIGAQSGTTRTPHMQSNIQTQESV